MTTIREDLKAFLDDELNDARRREVQDALAGSEEMRQEMEFLRLLGMEIRDGAVQPEPDGLEKTLNWLEMAERKPRLTKFPMWKLALGAVACMFIAMVFFPMFAQSKAASKRTMLMAQSRARAKAGEAEYGTLGAAPMDEAAPKAQSESPNADKDSGGIYLNNGTETNGDVPIGGAGGAGAKAAPMAGHVQPMPSSPLARPNLKQPGGGFTNSLRGDGTIDGDYVEVPGKVPAPALQKPLMIRTGQISLTVASAEKAEHDVTKIVESMQGIVQDTNVVGDKDQPGTAEMTVEVPEGKFTQAMEVLGKVGELVSHSTTGQDVTTQVADTEARLKVMRAEEDQYVTLLKAGRTIGQILEIKDRLSQVREQIESLDAQRKALRAQTSYSTITMTMSEKPKEPKAAATVPTNWSEDTLTSAKDALGGIGRFLAQTAIYLGVLSPIWVPVLIVGLWLRKRALA